LDNSKLNGDLEQTTHDGKKYALFTPNTEPAIENPHQSPNPALHRHRAKDST